jgi:hypothetical protein
MGSNWRIWIRFTGPQEKEDLSLPMKEYMNHASLIIESVTGLGAALELAPM